MSDPVLNYASPSPHAPKPRNVVAEALKAAGFAAITGAMACLAAHLTQWPFFDAMVCLVLAALLNLLTLGIALVGTILGAIGLCGRRPVVALAVMLLNLAIPPVTFLIAVNLLAPLRSLR